MFHKNQQQMTLAAFLLLLLVLVSTTTNNHGFVVVHAHIVTVPQQQHQLLLLPHRPLPRWTVTIMSAASCCRSSSRFRRHRHHGHNHRRKLGASFPAASTSTTTTLFGGGTILPSTTASIISFGQRLIRSSKHILTCTLVVAVGMMMMVVKTFRRRDYPGDTAAADHSSSFAMRLRSRLWPNFYETDPDYPEYPLIPNKVHGCPFIGCNVIKGSKTDGPNYFYKKASQSLGNPRIWSFYTFGKPVASIVGTKLVTKIQNMEFNKLQSMMGGSRGSSSSDGSSGSNDINTRSLFGGTNLMFERNKLKHQFLRQLVGSAINTPQALSALVPSIQDIASKYIDQILNDVDEVVVDDVVVDDNATFSDKGSIVKMETICYDYTTEIVSKQILGFDDNVSSIKELIELKVLIRTWLRGMHSWLTFLPLPFILKKQRPAFKARQKLSIRSPEI